MGRSRNQIMADALVARVTGREQATGTPVEIQPVMTDRAVLGGDDEPGQLGDRLTGHGPVPAWLGRRVSCARPTAPGRPMHAAPSGDLAMIDDRRRLFRAASAGSSWRATVSAAPPGAAPRSSISTTRSPSPAAAPPPVAGRQGLRQRFNHAKDAVGWWVRAILGTPADIGC